jgi:hypothetical protein
MLMHLPLFRTENVEAQYAEAENWSQETILYSIRVASDG